jgi:ribosomal protein S18 acetylase RimI-like enzyme
MTVLDLRPMTVADIPEALRLWTGMKGITLFASDSVEGITQYLHRNPNLSVVAHLDGELVGASMAGHDGRRGYLHHTAVIPGCRLRGIGRAMVEWCLARLTAEGIGRCHILVDVDNIEGLEFWKRLGWEVRPQVHLLSFTTNPERA